MCRQNIITKPAYKYNHIKILFSSLIRFLKIGCNCKVPIQIQLDKEEINLSCISNSSTSSNSSDEKEKVKVKDKEKSVVRLDTHEHSLLKSLFHYSKTLFLG